MPRATSLVLGLVVLVGAAGCGGGGAPPAAPPDLVAVAPGAGGIAGGRTVTLSGPRIGTGAANAVGVTFAGVAATAVTRLDDATLSCVTPPGAVGPCDVVVTTDHGTDTLPGGFLYVPAPTLSSVTPPAGPTAGGGPISLSGSGFLDHEAGTPTVTFGANVATDVVVTGDGTITCVAPPQAALGAYDVSVSNALGTVTLPLGYACVPPPSLSAVSIPDGPAGGLTSVTLSGADFDAGGIEVSFGGVPATAVTVVSPGSLTCSTPAGTPGVASISVRTYGGTATLLGAWTWTTFAPSDPLYGDQWHLLNTAQLGASTAGEDAHVVPAWTLGYTGRGVTVAVVDDGLELAHEDLAGNVKAGASWDYGQDDADPTGNEHGTSVAGVIAAVGRNGLGGVGAAPRSRLVGYAVLTSGTTNGDFADALARDASATDAYNNSWGDPAYYGGVLYGYADAPASFHAALDQGIRSGRGGLGSVYLKAAGNSGAPLATFDGTNGIRGINVIGAVNSQGSATYYSQPGPCILVCAPSNDSGRPGITTTDRTGAPGYSSTSYTSTFGGTSSATPLVCGVVALLLEVRPTLRWWEVPLILAETARKNDPTHAAWVQNGAGRWVNQQYGFGVVDAGAAVEAARTWVPRTGLVSTTKSRTVGATVLKNVASGVTSTIDVPAGTGLTSVHRATVAVYCDHTAASDLTIVLTSPAGTQSVLASSIRAPSTASNSVAGVALVSWRHLGEAPEGTWSLKVSDGQGVYDSTWSSWSLTLEGEGTPPAAPAVVATQAAVVRARPAAPQGLAEGDVTWWNGDRWCRARRDAGLLAEWAKAGEESTWLEEQREVVARVREGRGFRIHRLAPGAAEEALLRRAPLDAIPVTGQVFRDGPQGDGRLRVLTDRVLVRLDPGLSAARRTALEAAFGLRPVRESRVGEGWRVYRIPAAGPTALEVAARLLEAPGVLHAEPDWWTERAPS